MRRYLLLLLLFALVHAQLDEYALRDLKLFVNGKEFIVKGIAYQPVPLGYNTSAGLCSDRFTPFSEWKSACYDSDYYDGSVNARDPPAPADGWFKGLWTRDLPLLKEAGVNTLRVYLANAITAAASEAQLGQDSITSPTGKYHVPFFDAVQSYGMKIIWPLVSDQYLIANTPTATFQSWLRNQIDEVGNHPALLMYSLGNELPGMDSKPANSALIAKVNGYLDYARAYQAQKWGRWIPISTALIDASQYYDFLAANMHVDVMMLNIYRGTGFSDLWTGNRQTLGWRTLSCQYNMPTLLGELGWHQNANAMNIQTPNWWNQLYKSVLSNIDQGLIGSVFFEYSDEPYKTDPLQQTMGIVRFEPATANGKSSATSKDFWVPDLAVKKTSVNIWTSFVSGTVNGVQVNYNANEYAIMGRPQATYANSFSVCNGYPAAVTTNVPTTDASAIAAATTAQAAASSSVAATMAGSTSAAETTAAVSTSEATTLADTTSAAATSAAASASASASESASAAATTGAASASAASTTQAVANGASNAATTRSATTAAAAASSSASSSARASASASASATATATASASASATGTGRDRPSSTSIAVSSLAERAAPQLAVSLLVAFVVVYTSYAIWCE